MRARRRRNEPTPGSPRPAPHPAATGHPTYCSPSSTACDCADLSAVIPLPRQRSSHQVGTITRSAQSPLCRRRHNADYERRRIGSAAQVIARRSSGSGSVRRRMLRRPGPLGSRLGAVAVPAPATGLDPPRCDHGRCGTAHRPSGSLSCARSPRWGAVRNATFCPSGRPICLRARRIAA